MAEIRILNLPVQSGARGYHNIARTRYPLTQIPKCHKCNNPCERSVVSPNNPNGNANRPYYVCLNRSHSRAFRCWDDAKGIDFTNPPCECGLPSRQFKQDGTDLFSCATVDCDFMQEKGAQCDWWKAPQYQMPVPPARPAHVVPRGSKWEIKSESGESPLCTICRVVLEKLKNHQDWVLVDAKPKVRAEAGCHLCALVVQYTVRHTRCEGLEEPDLCYRYEFEEMDLGQYTFAVLSYETRYLDSLSKWFAKAEFGCLPSPAASQASGTPSWLSPLGKSILLAKQWIEGCSASHPICQHGGAANFIPTRVIDVGEKQLDHSLIRPVLREGKDLPPNTQYLTLSHRWGGDKPLRLMQDNLSSMMNSVPFDQLPKTFQDAIIVAQCLGSQYIWIDSLCIVQDSVSDWEYEAARMADVYRNGVCNISAADAENGSGGLFLDHSPIFARSVKALFTTNDQGKVLHDFWPEYVWNGKLSKAPLMTRGWVVQERLLSRRNLHFTREQAIWECRENGVCETFPDELPFMEVPRPLKHRFSRSLFSNSGGPNDIAQTWSAAVNRFTECELTVLTDKLVAFGGISSVFSEAMGNRYLAGLWRDNIAYQLCWQGKSVKSDEYIAPSWSWASTTGTVQSAFYPMHPPSVVRPLEVLQAHVDLKGDNPYGQVKNSSLHVAGRMTVARIVFENPHTKQKIPTLYLPDGEGDLKPLITTLHLNWTEAEITEALSRSSNDGLVYLIAALHHLNEENEFNAAMRGKPEMDSRRAPSTRWLILCPVGKTQATFQRCGTFTQSNAYWSEFGAACRWFEQAPKNVPLHSQEKDYGCRYAVKLV